jgi:predicted phosphoribosyltransferase
MVFASREDAGRRLANYFVERAAKPDIALGLPRGGVVVAAEVAHALSLPFDVLVVRKIGHPWHREFAVGALAEGGIVILDEVVIRKNPLMRTELQQVIKEEQQRLQSYQEMFRHGPLELHEKEVLLIDDGVAVLL